MDRPPVKEILDIWEQGEGRTLLENSLQLLRVASITPLEEDPVNLSIGERDIRLLRLRKQMFGPQLTNVAHCPACKEQVEWTTRVRDLIATHKQHPENELFDANIDQYHIRFRLPNSNDVLYMAVEHDRQTAAKTFLLRCIHAVENSGQTCDVTELPEEILDRLDKHMAEQDPLAVIQMSLTCSACAHSWPLTFDIISYLWIEIDHWARYTLREVAQMAYAFGWTESDILALSPRRRKLYLKMIGA